MQKTMKLKKLVEYLQDVEPFQDFKVNLDQYQSSATVASDFIHHIANNYGFEEANVVDLGCGTGILGIGALLCDAE